MNASLFFEFNICTIVITLIEIDFSDHQIILIETEDDFGEHFSHILLFRHESNLPESFTSVGDIYGEISGIGKSSSGDS